MIDSGASYGKLLVMPKFTTKDLLISTALVSLGCGLLWMIFNRPELIGDDHIFGLVFVWPCAFAMIGAGLLAPERRAESTRSEAAGRDVRVCGRSVCERGRCGRSGEVAKWRKKAEVEAEKAKRAGEKGGQK